MLVRPCVPQDRDAILAIINNAAIRYAGVIPDELWHQPYMSGSELDNEVRAGVTFWGAVADDQLNGVMGFQRSGEVNLLRHAYVLDRVQRSGIGQALLDRLSKEDDRPILVGTWKAASWAIEFYKKNGFRELASEETRRLLGLHWNISELQATHSVVLERH